MALGIYISVPFCRSKCSYCNFASGVFSQNMFALYVERVCADIMAAEQTANEVSGRLDPPVDSIYLGGGTPTMLPPDHLRALFRALRERFDVTGDCEITVECAPGTLSNEVLATLVGCGVNRVSLGVQSFVDEEARAVGRLHTRTATLEDITRLRAAGIANLNVDLIAGLPHQTRESWARSLGEAIATGAGHVSVYMLEIDEDSRLGREVIAGGTRYHAHFVPDEELTADLYTEACETLSAAGISQYEISNFARPGCESRHNLKYWTRQPYLGFGVDAHSFLPPVAAAGQESGAVAWDGVRFATSDSLETYLSRAPLTLCPVSLQDAREESFFLGLRLNRGVDLKEVARRYSFGPQVQRTISELYELGLLDYDRQHEVIRLTRDGRLLSNEVFERFIEG